MRRRHFLSLLGSGLLIGCGSAVNSATGSGSGTSDADGGWGNSGGPSGTKRTNDGGTVADGGTGDADGSTVTGGEDAGARTDGGSSRGPAPVTPNVLFIMCDQLRSPMWFPAGMDAFLPNMAALRNKSVSFGQHYTAAIQCSPARASLLTGLYGRQHFLGKNIAGTEGVGPAMDTRIPTWGSLFAKLDLGYERRWFGKWHLSPIVAANAAATWSSYGFSPGLPYDPTKGDIAPDGDADSVTAFKNWLTSRSGSAANTPWMTTVSLVNPHDIMAHFGSPKDPAPPATPPMIATALPGNYESAAAIAANKPKLQTFFLQNMDVPLPMPHGQMSDSATVTAWVTMLNLYIQLQRDVDALIGQVLAALASSPYAGNTIVVFTADHGEHGGSHSLRAKHGSAYDETLRIPFYVYDPTGYWTGAIGTTRTQLTSSVDILPLLLTMASGGSGWRTQAGFEHLSMRPDLSGILLDPGAADVRSYILHTSDSIGPGLATLNGKSIANHVTAIRTKDGKLVRYEGWINGTRTVDAQVTTETECYDYSTTAGQNETANLGTAGTLYKSLADQFASEGLPELNEAIEDPTIQAGQAAALAAYWQSTFSS